jgi:hypothetical protein
MIVKRQPEERKVKANFNSEPPENTRSKKRKRHQTELKMHKLEMKEQAKRAKLEQVQFYGASYLRYEIIEKKGQKVLLPVRYSVRNGHIADQLVRQEILDNSFINYNPSDMEKNFKMASPTKQIREILS